MDMRRMDHIRRNCQIVVEEFGAQRVVGDDATYFRCRQKHHLRTADGEPAVDRGLIAQIGLAAGAVSSSTFSAASRRTSADPTMPRCPAT